MKQITLLCLAFILFISHFSCNAQTKKKENAQKSSSTKVEVYYFHYTRRCHTCQSVEKNAKLAVESLYADKVKSGKYIFKAINLDEEKNTLLAEKLGVGGQTLLVVCGKNKVDITDKAFMNATNLEKMKIEIQKAVTKVTK